MLIAFTFFFFFLRLVALQLPFKLCSPSRSFAERGMSPRPLHNSYTNTKSKETPPTPRHLVYKHQVKRPHLKISAARASQIKNEKERQKDMEGRNLNILNSLFILLTPRDLVSGEYEEFCNDVIFLIVSSVFALAIEYYSCYFNIGKKERYLLK